MASIPLEDIANLGPLGSAARAAGVLAVITTMLAVASGTRIRRINPTILILGAFVEWAMLSFFWTLSPDKTFARIVTNLQFLLLVWVVWQFMDSAVRIRTALNVFVTAVAAGSLLSLVVRQPHFTGVNDVQRFSIGGPNSFGVQVVAAMVMALYLMQSSTSPRAKRLYAAFLIVGVLEVFSTASRTALIAMVLAGCALLVDQRTLRPQRVLGLLGVLTVAGMAIVMFVDQAQLDRITSIQEATTEDGLDGRVTQWGLTWDTFSEHPITGVGAAAFRDQSSAATGVSKVAHNSFLGVLADLGAVGLLLFCAVFVVAGWRILRLSPDLRRLWTTLCMVWMIGASTLTWEQHKFTYLFVILLAAQTALVSEQTDPIPARRARADPSPRAG
ncbi:MAG: O-antigen ligase family protein [Acidimicrobiales bacterium]